MTTKPKPIRILRLIARMNVGGPAIQISCLMNDLDSELFDQLLVTGECDENELDFLDINDFDFRVHKIVGFGRRIGLISDFKTFLEIRSIIKTFKPDLIHTHTAKAGAIGRLASISTLQKHKLVHTFHGHLLHSYFGGFQTKLVVLIERFLAYFTHTLVSVGIKVKSELIQAGIGTEESIRVITPGLDLKQIPAREKSLRRFGLDEHDFTIGWIGRLVEIKAPERILEIARLLKEKDYKVRFLVVGDGPLFNHMRTFALEEELPIYFLGWQTEIESVLAIMDVLILTSKNEGTPISLIESQLAGIPVIASKVGSVSEVLIDGFSGFCIDYSAEVFVERLTSLINDDVLRIDFGLNARSFAMKTFSKKQFIFKYKSLYCEILNRAT